VQVHTLFHTEICAAGGVGRVGAVELAACTRVRALPARMRHSCVSVLLYTLVKQACFAGSMRQSAGMAWGAYATAAPVFKLLY
jgi:hypothetical protein